MGSSLKSEPEAKATVFFAHHLDPTVEDAQCLGVSVSFNTYIDHRTRTQSLSLPVLTQSSWCKNPVAIARGSDAAHGARTRSLSLLVLTRSARTRSLSLPVLTRRAAVIAGGRRGGGGRRSAGRGGVCRNAGQLLDTASGDRGRRRLFRARQMPVPYRQDRRREQPIRRARHIPLLSLILGAAISREVLNVVTNRPLLSEAHRF